MDTITQPLTHEQICLMPAGQEMDILVAKLVLGYTFREKEGRKQFHPPEEEDNVWEGMYWLPEFSKRLVHAFSIVDKITKSLDELITDDGEKYGYWALDRLGYDCCSKGKPDKEGVHGEWRCDFSMNKSDAIRLDCYATADTAPLAICRSALISTLREKESSVVESIENEI